jgi:two-component system response regulator VanR
MLIVEDEPLMAEALVLRLRALDRTRAHNRPRVREILRVHPFRREVHRDGRYVVLARKQCAVLAVLVADGAGYRIGTQSETGPEGEDRG